MSAREALAALATGRCPADNGLLGNCRMEWAGAEVYGEEAILELFRAAPFVPGEEAAWVESPLAAAWVGAEEALVADLYDGRIGRLWRIGGAEAPAREPAVAVAFDPDLRQRRGDVYARAEDHPSLAPEAYGGVIAAGEALVARADPAPLHRARAFLIRAFSAGETTAALFAVHRLGGGAVRTSGFGEAVALIDGGGTRLVVDATLAPEWTPRL